MSTLPPIKSRSSMGSTPSTADPRLRASTSSSALKHLQQQQQQQQQQKQQASSSPQAAVSNAVTLVLNLLTQEYTKDLIDKHNHSFKKLFKRCKEAGNAFSVDDLKYLELILQDLYGRIFGDEESSNNEQHTSSRGMDADSYVAHLANLLTILCNPINCDSLQNQRDIPAVASSFGAILLVAAQLISSPTALTTPALSLLNSIVKRVVQYRSKPPSTGGVARAWLEAQAKVIEESMSILPVSVNATLLLLLSTTSSKECLLTEEQQKLLLELVWQLSVIPEQLDNLINEQTPRYLCLLLGNPAIDPTTHEGLLLVETMWNCWEDSGREDSIIPQIDSGECMHALGVALRHAFKPENSATRTAKQARNDIITLIALFSRQPELQDSLVEGHVLEYCLRFACCGDVRTFHPDCRNSNLSVGDEDFEAMKLLLSTVFPLLAEPSSAEVVAASNILDLIALYIVSAFDGDKKCRDWSQPQYDELLLLLLSLLPAILPNVAADFIEKGMDSMILDLLIWSFDTVSSGEGDVHSHTLRIKGAANSFMSTGDFCVDLLDNGDTSQNNGRRVYALLCLKTLQSLLYLLKAEEAHTHEMIDNIAIYESKRGNEGELEKKNEEKGENGSASTSLLFDTLNKAKVSLIENGIMDVLKDFLRKQQGSSPTDDILNKVTAHVWSVCSLLCFNTPALQSGFGGEGVDLLLAYFDVNEDKLSSDEEYQFLILAVLDATWNCVVSFTENRDVFLAHEGVYMLLDLLQKCSFQTQYMAIGVLTELCEYPSAVKHVLHWKNSGATAYSIVTLLVALWEEENASFGCSTIVDPETKHPLRVNDEQSFDNRGRVYMLAYLIGFDGLYEIASPQEKVTLILIEQYLNLKCGEKWWDVQQELYLQDIEPVEDDVECLKVAEVANTMTVKGVVDRQRRALEEAGRMEEEEQFSSMEKLKMSVRLRDTISEEEGSFVRTLSEKH